jgi:glyoxylase-like metal-dependent hydrolase (beta-lactamase superfamily II)
MGDIDLETLKNSGSQTDRELAAKIRPAGTELIQGVEVIGLPGHTPGTAAIVFDSADGRVAVCGDAVMTRDFFRARRGYYNSADFEMAGASISKLADLADIIVPGHDNYFLTKRINV